jgi:hypothetical protein
VPAGARDHLALERKNKVFVLEENLGRSTMNGEFLRKKARRLLLLADACFDGDTARQLRLMADEFQTIADREEPVVPLALINGGRGHASGGLDLH